MKNLGIIGIDNLTSKTVDEINEMRNYTAVRKVKSIKQTEIAEIMGIDSRTVHLLEARYANPDKTINKQYKDAIDTIIASQQGGSDE